MKYFLSVLLLIIFCSCAKNNLPDTSNYKMSAVINGVSWATNNIAFLGNDSTGIMAIIGGDSTEGGAIQLNLSSANGFATGTYNFRPTGIDSAITGTFFSIKAAIAPGSILVNWSASDTSSATFNIEKSTNGIDFSTIGSVQAIANDTIVNYSFSDKNPVLGINNYYRLERVSLGGAITYSAITVVHNFPAASANYDGYPCGNGTLQITVNDSINNIHTGTFSFDCTLPGGLVIQVRNGKFNVR
jgi:hypothetical protein